MMEQKNKPSFDDIFGVIKPEDEYSKPQTIIIYGNLGTGKTTLATGCNRLGKTVLINFENRISHIKETENLRIVPTSTGDFRENKRCTYEQFINFIDYVVQNDIKINYMIIDTLDMMLQVFIKGMLRKGEIQDKFYGRAEVYPKITEYIQKIKETGTTVIITAQENNKDIETDLLIVSNFKSHINPILDGVYYLKYLGDNERILYLKPTTNIFIKPPSVPIEKFESIPEKIENPTWEKIAEVLS